MTSATGSFRLGRGSRSGSGEFGPDTADFAVCNLGLPHPVAGSKWSGECPMRGLPGYGRLRVEATKETGDGAESARTSCRR